MAHALHPFAFDPIRQDELPPLLIFITNQEVINFKWSITMQN